MNLKYSAIADFERSLLYRVQNQHILVAAVVYKFF